MAGVAYHLGGQPVAGQDVVGHGARCHKRGKMLQGKLSRSNLMGNPHLSVYYHEIKELLLPMAPLSLIDNTHLWLSTTFLKRQCMGWAALGKKIIWNSVTILIQIKKLTKHEYIENSHCIMFKVIIFWTNFSFNRNNKWMTFFLACFIKFNFLFHFFLYL